MPCGGATQAALIWLSVGNTALRPFCTFVPCLQRLVLNEKYLVEKQLSEVSRLLGGAEKIAAVLSVENRDLKVGVWATFSEGSNGHIRDCLPMGQAWGVLRTVAPTLLLNSNCNLLPGL